MSTKSEDTTLQLSEDLELRLLNMSHKDELFALVDDNREHLRKWLPWVNTTRSPADMDAFLSSAINQHKTGRGPHYAALYEGAICGVCGFHPVDLNNKVASMGYWVSQAYSGKGIITLSVKALLELGFRDHGLNRIEIACATENTKSRAIPERLNFTFEGVLREREYLNGRYLDHAVYSMLASEFQRKRGVV